MAHHDLEECNCMHYKTSSAASSPIQPSPVKLSAVPQPPAYEDILSSQSHHHHHQPKKSHPFRFKQDEVEFVRLQRNGNVAVNDIARLVYDKYPRWIEVPQDRLLEKIRAVRKKRRVMKGKQQEMELDEEEDEDMLEDIPIDGMKQHHFDNELPPPPVSEPAMLPQITVSSVLTPAAMIANLALRGKPLESSIN